MEYGISLVDIPGMTYLVTKSIFIVYRLNGIYMSMFLMDLKSNSVRALCTSYFGLFSLLVRGNLIIYWNTTTRVATVFDRKSFPEVIIDWCWYIQKYCTPVFPTCFVCALLGFHVLEFLMKSGKNLGHFSEHTLSDCTMQVDDVSESTGITKELR